MTSTLPNIQTVWSSFQMNLNAYRFDREFDLPHQRSTIPVVLIAGFLGSGKSYLLAQLLQNNHGVRIKAIVNDVGTLPIDPTLVDTATTSEIVLMNGCGCCDQTADLAQSLEEMARDEACDFIVLEASGAGDPWALSHIIEASPFVHLDRIVYVIDEREVRALRDEDDYTMQRQGQRRESAHCVVISHCDELTQSERDELIDCLATQLPGRTIVCSSLREPSWQAMLPTHPVGARPISFEIDSSHEQLAVVTVSQKKVVSRSVLMDAFQLSRPGLLRAKGVLCIDGVAHRVQLTPRTESFEPCSNNFSGGKVTLIARRIEDLERVLACIT